MASFFSHTHKHDRIKARAEVIRPCLRQISGINLAFQCALKTEVRHGLDFPKGDTVVFGLEGKVRCEGNLDTFNPAAIYAESIKADYFRAERLDQIAL